MESRSCVCPGDQTPGEFRLVIQLGSDAMQNAYDIASALDDVARRMRNLGPDMIVGLTSGPIRDINGNVVGDFTVPLGGK